MCKSISKCNYYIQYILYYITIYIIYNTYATNKTKKSGNHNFNHQADKSGKKCNN